MLYKKILGFALISLISINLAGCYGTTKCLPVTKAINDVLLPSYSPDGKKIAFIYRKSEKGKITNNIYVSDSNGNNSVLVKKVDSEIAEDLPVPVMELKWLENGNLLFQKKSSDGSIGKLIVIDQNNKTIKEKDNISLNNFNDDNSFNSSFDGRYILNNLDLFDLETSENIKLVIDDEKFKIPTQAWGLRINLIPQSENKVHIQYSYNDNLNQLFSSAKIMHYIGTLDINNKKISELINFNDAPEQNMELISFNGNEIYYRDISVSDKIDIYKINLSENKTEKVNSYSLKKDLIQEAYTLSTNKIIQWSYLNKKITTFLVKETNESNSEINGLPLGDSLTYTECSTSTL